MDKELIEKFLLKPERVAEIVSSIHSDPLFDKILPVEPRRYRALLIEQLKEAIPLIAGEILKPIQKRLSEISTYGSFSDMDKAVVALLYEVQSLRTKNGVDK